MATCVQQHSVHYNVVMSHSATTYFYNVQYKYTTVNSEVVGGQ